MFGMLFGMVNLPCILAFFGDKTVTTDKTPKLPKIIKTSTLEKNLSATQNRLNDIVSNDNGSWHSRTSVKRSSSNVKPNNSLYKGKSIELSNDKIKDVDDIEKGDNPINTEVKTEEIKNEEVKIKVEEVKVEEIKPEEIKTDEVNAEEIKTDEIKPEEKQPQIEENTNQNNTENT